MKYKITIVIGILLTITLQLEAQDSLVARYPFYNMGTDATGNGNTLARLGSPLPVSEYQFCRRYMSFNNTQGHMRNADPGFEISSAFTVTFWMRTPDLMADQKIVGQADLQPGDFGGYVIGPENGRLKTEIFAGDPSNTMTVRSSELDADTWYHVALVYEDGAEYNLYIDGDIDTFLNDQLLLWSPPTMSQDLVVGVAPWDDQSFYYDGDLDDLRIYNDNLSASDILAIYNGWDICPTGLQPIYVDQDAVGQNSGLTWEDAFTDLQEAMEHNCDCDAGKGIWVAEGTYHPTQDLPFNDINTIADRSFFLPKPMRIYGGFIGDEQFFNQRFDQYSPPHETILTASHGNMLDTSYHVLTIGPMSNEFLLIDGFTIRDGRATGSGFNDVGGGIRMSASILDRIFIRNCKFINNYAVHSGGAIYASGQTCNVDIAQCTFQDNESGQFGGGICANGLATEVKIYNSTLIQNRSCTGGALYITSSFSAPDIELTNNIFWNNTASASADEVYIDKGGTATTMIKNSVFTSNGIEIGDMMDIDTSQIFITDDPLLDSNLQLQLSSPAIDMGDSSSVTPIQDINGKPRIMREAVDIGAHEYGDVCNDKYQFLLPMMFVEHFGFYGTQEDIIVNAYLGYDSNVTFSYGFDPTDNVTFLEDFEVERGSQMAVYQEGCEP